jgi:E1A/CREB-binding protein
MYEQAEDQQRYFDLLAERINKIQKEFEDKHQPAEQAAPANGQKQTSSTLFESQQQPNGPLQVNYQQLDNINAYPFILPVGEYHVNQQLLISPNRKSTDSLAESDLTGHANLASSSSTGDLNLEAEDKLEPDVERFLKSFLHASQCRDGDCTFHKCKFFKRVLKHSTGCQRPLKRVHCKYCSQVIALCYYHARTCKDEQCQVVFCSLIKQHLIT